MPYTRPGLSQTSLNELERLVDKHGMANVLRALDGIANEKEEHIATNWPGSLDENTWCEIAEQLEPAIETADCLS